MSKKNGKLKEHELSKYFPMLSADEFATLRDDIREHGQLEPITIYNGEVLDGRNRLAAVDELGIDPKFRDYEGDDPLSYVVSINLIRRSLSPGQRAAVGARLTADSEYGRDGPDPESVSQETVSVKAVAEQLGVGSAQLTVARDLEQNHSDLFEELETGQISITRATGLRAVVNVPGLSKAQRKAAIKKADEFKDRDVSALAIEVEDAVIKQGSSGFKQVMGMTTGAIIEHTMEVRPGVHRKKPVVDTIEVVNYMNDGMDAIADLKHAWKGIQTTDKKSEGDKQSIVASWWSQISTMIAEWDDFAALQEGIE
ncbi:hypothetical protein LCGC14_0693670 [marine sediment metagenome]|uniref:ParB-like N-terminal domain-containing protein n=1 Tax=marine sediment metagenome TaxID=412755 RepID=A0A0F9T604_9ZZZZ